MDFSPLQLALTTIVIIAVITDVHYQRIPNVLTIPALFCGLAYNAFINSSGGLVSGLEGAFTGALLFIVPYLLGVVGGGDLKLFAALGAFLGPADIITAFIMTAITGGFYAIVLAMASGRLKETCTGVFNKLKAFLFTREPSCLRHDQDSVSGELKLYYGVAIAFGTLLSVFYKS